MEVVTDHGIQEEAYKFADMNASTKQGTAPRFNKIGISVSLTQTTRKVKIARDLNMQGNKTLQVSGVIIYYVKALCFRGQIYLKYRHH